MGIRKEIKACIDNGDVRDMRSILASIELVLAKPKRKKAVPENRMLTITADKAEGAVLVSIDAHNKGFEPAVIAGVVEALERTAISVITGAECDCEECKAKCGGK